jgi:hypothetical protein
VLNAHLFRGFGYGLCAKVVNFVETLRALLLQYADEVNGGLGIPQRMGDGFGKSHIRLDGVNLAGPSERLQMESEVWPAHGNPDPPALPRQGAHGVPSDKARPAKHSYEPAGRCQIIRHHDPPSLTARSFRAI